jgi:hypothetical protein
MLNIPIPSITDDNGDPACRRITADGAILSCPYFREGVEGKTVHRSCKLFSAVLVSRDKGSTPTPCNACRRYRTDPSDTDGPTGTCATVELEGGSLTLMEVEGHKSLQVCIHATKTFISIDPQRLLDNYATGCVDAMKEAKGAHLKDLLDQIREMEQAVTEDPYQSWHNHISLDTVLGMVGKKLVDGKVVNL